MSSDDHIAALDVEEGRQQTVAKGLADTEVRRRESVLCALRTVYWLAREEIANVKYSSLVDMQRLQGVNPLVYLNHGRNSHYQSATIHNELLEAIDTVLVRELKRDLKSSPCVSIGVDESTDRSKEKHVVTVVRYVNGSGLRTTVLKLTALQ